MTIGLHSESIGVIRDSPCRTLRRRRAQGSGLSRSPRDRAEPTAAAILVRRSFFSRRTIRDLAARRDKRLREKKRQYAGRLTSLVRRGGPDGRRTRRGLGPTRRRKTSDGPARNGSFCIIGFTCDGEKSRTEIRKNAWADPA